MKIFTLLVFCIFLSSGDSTSTFSYDHSATAECLKEPERVQYKGGIVYNPEFNYGLEGWTESGGGAKREVRSKGGNKFIVLHDRTKSFDSLLHNVQLQKSNIYSFSAWVQTNKGTETIAVVFRTPSGGEIIGGRIEAKHGCWSLLKGGMVANFSGSVDVLLKTKHKAVDIWVDNVSLQPFTPQQWRSNQEKIIDKIRKSKVRFRVSTVNGTIVEGAEISINQVKSDFPFGCGMNYHILTSQDYRDWFSSRFRFSSFTNEMKWYSTEKKPGEENYTIPDAMMSFCRENDIFVRGHNILWDNPKMQPSWVKNLPSDELLVAAIRRTNSVVSRYKGQLICWDVMNENLHFRFYEDKLGENASAIFYSLAYGLDSYTSMFMNEYNTIELGKDASSTPIKYKEKIQQLLSYPEVKGMLAGIGLQGHFNDEQPNIPYIRTALDILGTTGVPIWLTEVDVEKNPNQAEYLEEILREAYSHPAVEGIIIFGGPIVAGFSNMTLADENFMNTPTGDVVDQLIKEWRTENQTALADNQGFCEINLFHGDYKVTVKHPLTNISSAFDLRVTKQIPRQSVNIQIGNI